MRKIALFTTLMHLSCSSGKGDSGPDDNALDSGSDSAFDSVPDTGDSVADTGDSASEAGLVRELATADAIVRSDVCGQTFGGAIFTNIDLNGDSLEDVLVAGANPYCSEHAAWYGFFSGEWVAAETTAESSADVIIGSVQSDGKQGRPAGDVDGDGFDDLLSASCGSEQMPCLLFGPFAGELDPDSARMVRIEGPHDTQSFYLPLSGDMAAGDLDGDGAVDVVVSDVPNGGAAWVAYGPLDQDVDLDDNFKIRGEDGEEFGWDVGFPGDLDGDGAADLAVSAAERNDEQYYRSGALYVFREPVLGDISAGDADATVGGDTNAQALGRIWPLGDLNGDGYDDLVVSGENASDGEDSAGGVFVIHGPAPADGHSTVASAAARLLGEAEGDDAGSVARAGDVNDDGSADVFVGATQPDVDLGKAGVSYLVLGPLAGTMSLADSAVRFPGTSAGEQAGIVAGNVDLNGDGELDLVVGAPEWPSYDLANGSIYGLFGPLM